MHLDWSMTKDDVFDLATELDILRSADYLIMACEHYRIPDVACGGIGGLILDTGHRQVPPSFIG